MDLFKSIKTETSFREGISRLYPHIKIERSGKHDRIRCPFHDDQDPSLVLYQSSYFCFGCGSGGDLVDFVGTLDGLGRLSESETVVAHSNCSPQHKFELIGHLFSDAVNTVVTEPWSGE